mmetsp:Transcript_7405/g.31406  ORF Transcript_7405/g.31406 Transcript_7405/m.31406 type:complete len:342 (+) Transcript_7405:47-1072(+)
MANAILLLVLFTAAAGGLLFASTIHQVPEGHVGVYWRGGALLDETTGPGFHSKLPMITRVEFVQITLQTDTVREIPCGTSGGSIIYFDKIEVVNRLDATKAHDTIKLYGPDYDKTWIFDKIHHEINQFCSGHSLQEVYISEFERLDEELANALQRDCDHWNTGISIISIRVTKPRVPPAVLRNYEKIEEEKTRLMVSVQEQKVTEMQEETLKIQARSRAEREAEVDLINANKEASISKIAAEMELAKARINMEQQIAEKEGLKTLELLQNEIHLEKERAKSEALKFAIEQEAEAWSKKLTPEFLKYTLYSSLANNTKIYFGESIPSIMQQWMKGQGDDILL